MFFLLLHNVLADTPQLHGYGELRLLTYPQGTHQWQTVQRIRPSLNWNLNRFITLKSTFDLSLFQGRDEAWERTVIIRPIIESAVPPNIDGYKYSLEDICTICGWDVEFGRPHPWQTIMDRLTLDITLSDLDIRIGRQSLEWSEMFLFNNTDPLPQNLIQTPWQERRGIDALRTRFSIGTQTDADILLTMQTFSFRVRHLIEKIDLSLISHIAEEKQIIALSARGDNFIGWRTEWVYHHTQEPYIHASAATDYTFNVLNGLMLYLQTTYDSSGNIPELYAWNKRDWGIAIQDCSELNLQVPDLGTDVRQTLGKWYVVGNSTLSFESNWQLRYATLLNLMDYSGIHMLYLQWQQEHLSLQVAFLKGYGNDGEFAPSSLQTSLLGHDISTLIPAWKWMSWFRFQY